MDTFCRFFPWPENIEEIFEMTFCEMLCLGNMAKWVGLAVLKF